MKIFKFGGASLKDTNGLKNAAKILNLYKNENILLVVSAMGKMTNAFERLHKEWFKNNDTNESLNVIKDYHFTIINEIFESNAKVFFDVNKIFSDLEKTISGDNIRNKDFDASYDSIVSFAEIISSTILYHFLLNNNFNLVLEHAQSMIITDNSFREARINWELTEKSIVTKYKSHFSENSEPLIMLTQGFIGATRFGEPTTLGREGSDFSASVFGYCLNVKDITIWKDVDGLYNADPKVFDEVELINHISYYEAVELAYYGQSIIHPKTIKPLQNKNIPLFIKSFIDPSLKGTLIDGNKTDDINVPCYILKKNQVLVSVASIDYSFINEQNLGLIFSTLAKTGIRVNVMQNSAISFSFCADQNEYKLNTFISVLKDFFQIRFNTGLELITIRNYNSDIIEKLTKNKQIYLEQKSRNTIQFVVMPSN